MENEMRKQIEKVKSFGKFLNENIETNVLSNKLKEYDKIKEDVTQLLLNEIQRIARLELRNNQNFNEFIMGMGTYFFTSKKSETNLRGDTTSSYKSKEIDKLISKYDDEFNLTGEGMRFTVDGDVITDW